MEFEKDTIILQERKPDSDIVLERVETTSETINSVIEKDLQNDTFNYHIPENSQSNNSISNFIIDKTPAQLNSEKSELGDSMGSYQSKEESVPHKVLKVDAKKKKRKRNRRKKKLLKQSNSDLSSSLQDGICTDLYIKTDMLLKQKLHKTQVPNVSSIVKDRDIVLKKSVLPVGVEKEHSLPPYEVSLNQTRKQRKLERSQTKGPLWYDMKAPELTAEKKNDLEILQMRDVLNPKHFYKKLDTPGLPKFFQTGRIIEDATDFYSGRIPKKQRKKTLVDELLADVEFKKYNKRKYAEIIEKTQKHKGAHKHMKRLKKKKK